MMIPKSMAVLATAASLSLAATPNGFEPASQVDLIVIFNSTTALNGAVVTRTATTSQPRIGTTTRLNGTSYAVLMIDIDIPTNSPPQTNTLLHWFQTNLVPSQASTTITVPGSSSPLSVFLLENRTTNASPPVTPYFGPNPPARIPLSHRYTQILVDTSNVTPQGIRTLEQAARPAGGGVAIGFNASAVLSSAGLSGKVVAGNFFNVTNPGPVAGAANGTNINAGTGNGTTTGGRGGGSRNGGSETGTGHGGRNGTGSGGVGGAGGDGVRSGNGGGFNQGNVTTAGAGRLVSTGFGGLGTMLASCGALALGFVVFT